MRVPKKILGIFFLPSLSFSFTLSLGEAHGHREQGSGDWIEKKETNIAGLNTHSACKVRVHGRTSPFSFKQPCKKVSRGGEKKRLLINRDYIIDDYESIITFPKIDIYLFIYFSL